MLKTIIKGTLVGILISLIEFLIAALFVVSFDVHITRTRFEDNSNRIVITYCEPFGLCSER